MNKGTGKQREMAKKVRQCRKETAGIAALSTAHMARGKNNNVDSSVGESILRANEYFCEVAEIAIDEANSGMFNCGPEFSVGFDAKF